MSKSLKYFSVLFVTLGILAFAIGEPKQTQPDDLALSFAEFDEIICMPVKQISAIELADYLIKQEHHYNLIDLQGEQASYQIPTAEKHSIDSFLAKKIPINETIFIYSEFETQALQLYYVLIMRGYFKVKILTGGLAAWTDEVLQPNPTKIDVDSIQHRREITEFFGGSFNSTNRNIEIKEVLFEKKKKKHHGC